MLFTPENGYYLLDQHLERLESSASFFCFSCNRSDIQEILTEKGKQCKTEKRVRLVLDKQGHIKLDYFELPKQSKSKLKLSIAEKPVKNSNIYLFHKTTNREVYDQAMNHCKIADDVVLYNQDGEITESCIANIAIQIEEKWVTPPISCGLLAGTKRAELLDKNKLTECVFYKEDLMNATEIKLFNSVRGEYLVELI